MIEQQSWLQFECVVFLVGEHDSALVGDCLVDDDPDHALAGDRALQHLLAENAGELYLVVEQDGARVVAFGDHQFSAVGGALGDFFGEGGDDDVGGYSWLDDHAHVVLAVIGALP